MLLVYVSTVEFCFAVLVNILPWKVEWVTIPANEVESGSVVVLSGVLPAGASAKCNVFLLIL